MDNNNNYNWSQKSVFVENQSGTVSKKFFASVSLWMFVALLLSTVSALVMANSPEMRSYLFNETTGGLNILGYVAMFSPLVLVMAMSAGLSRFSYAAILGIFILYSILTGVSLSFILLTYTAASVAGCFGAAAAIFGVMAFLGYTTETDLTKFRSILFAGVIGLVIAMLINTFLLKSSGFDYIISFAGVAIFTALTAYKVQELKRIGAGIEENGATMEDDDPKKLAIMGALSLYLSFVNIFLFLLRIFGGRK